MECATWNIAASDVFLSGNIILFFQTRMYAPAATPSVNDTDNPAIFGWNVDYETLV
jgi:hypothetical protein